MCVSQPVATSVIRMKARVLCCRRKNVFCPDFQLLLFFGGCFWGGGGGGSATWSASGLPSRWRFAIAGQGNVGSNFVQSRLRA